MPQLGVVTMETMRHIVSLYFVSIITAALIVSITGYTSYDSERRGPVLLDLRRWYSCRELCKNSGELCDGCQLATEKVAQCIHHLRYETLYENIRTGAQTLLGGKNVNSFVMDTEKIIIEKFMENASASGPFVYESVARSGLRFVGSAKCVFLLTKVIPTHVVINFTVAAIKEWFMTFFRLIFTLICMEYDLFQCIPLTTGGHPYIMDRELVFEYVMGPVYSEMETLPRSFCNLRGWIDVQMMFIMQMFDYFIDCTRNGVITALVVSHSIIEYFGGPSIH